MNLHPPALITVIIIIIIITISRSILSILSIFSLYSLDALDALSSFPSYKNDLVGQVRILQYSGDADPCVPYVGTQRWIDSLALKTTTPWHPWTTHGRISGYATVSAARTITRAIWG